MVKTATHGIAHCVWLLTDFLEHVVGIVPLTNVFGCELDFADGMLGDVSGKRTDLELVRPRSHQIEVVQINCVPCVSDNRADVTGQKIFAVADAKHQRTSAARADHEIRHIRMNQRDAICAYDLPKRRSNSLKQPPPFPGSSNRA